MSRYDLHPPFSGRIWIGLGNENVVLKSNLPVANILKRNCKILTSFAVQLDFFSDKSTSFTLRFISSNVNSPLDGIFSDAIVVAISKRSSILSMSDNALMLHTDKLNANDQNFVTCSLKPLKTAKRKNTSLKSSASS